MLDVIALLNAPAPWEDHGATAPMPEDFKLLAAMGALAPPESYFVTSGPADGAVQRARLRAPGLGLAAAAQVERLAPDSLAGLQSAIQARLGAPGGLRLILEGKLAWDGTLTIEGAQGLWLDFSALAIEVRQDQAPLIRIARSAQVSVTGLKVGQAHRLAVDVQASRDIAVTGCALAGAEEAAVRISGGAERVLVDRSAFLRNPGAAVQVLGEAAQVLVLRSVFEGPTRQPFLALAAAHSARGLATPAEGEPGRDALVMAHPQEIRVLENRFGASDHPAIRAEGILGLWIERNDFLGSAGGALAGSGPALGLHLADNRIAAAPGAQAAMIRLEDQGLAAIFRNVLEPMGQAALEVSGRFGALLVAGNSLMVPPGAGAAPPAAIRLDSNGAPGFLSTVIMLNTIRGAFGSGIEIAAALPRLFLFDNHLFGMSDWSLAARAPQPMATSINNWSPVKSLNLPLSETMIVTGPMLR